MTVAAWLPVATLLSSLTPGLLIFALPAGAHRTRITFNLIGAALKLVLVALLLWGVWLGERYEARLTLVPELDLILRVDPLAMLFVTLSAGLWFVTTIYAISYLAGTGHQNRFFGFFAICVAATTGIALAGNAITFLVFYELLTLSTWPLVVHRGDAGSLAAGRRYLAYTLAANAPLLLGVVWMQSLTGPVEFAEGPQLGAHLDTDRGPLILIFWLLIAGLGVKAALVPLHGWLPTAMVAPAPVSALLHAVAVVKAGAFGIVRVVHDVYGTTLVRELGVGLPLALLAAATILYGSVLALRQTDLKRRLAFSTVSQVSYITLGVALAGPIATIGGLVHLIHQGLMKITMFFCAGAFAETVHAHRVDQLDGIGRRMPWTTLAFSVAALGMIGVPPVAGFISKWYLGTGALEAGQPWVIFVLAGSSLLNAAYFLPILYRAWFRPPAGCWHEDAHRAGSRFETSAGLFLPPVVTAAAALAAGLFAGFAASPLGWATLIAALEHGR